MKPEEFAEAIVKSRELVASGKYNACPCVQTRCEWHGKCFECVLIHRTKKHHLPECFQPLFKEKIKQLAKMIESDIADDGPTDAHWDYLHRVAPPTKKA
jgi:hypothetical protein